MSLPKLVNGTFEGLRIWHILNISYSSPLEIEPGLFSDIGCVDVLSLRWNSLTKIATDGFKGLCPLSSLDLSYNNITYLEEYIFGEIGFPPRYINLEHNNLISLPANFSSLQNLNSTKIYVDYNCLDCSLVPYQKSLVCHIQSNYYCPSSNICKDLDKFQQDHCFKCNNSDTNSFCDICMPGYKMTGSGCGCVKCEKDDKCEFGEVRKPGSCFSCTSEIPTKCTSCSVGYSYADGDCSLCEKNECCPGGQQTKPSYRNCAVCSENQTTCLQCMDKYVLKKGACVKKKHSSGSALNQISITMISFLLFVISIIGYF